MIIFYNKMSSVLWIRAWILIASYEINFTIFQDPGNAFKIFGFGTNFSTYP